MALSVKHHELQQRAARPSVPLDINVMLSLTVMPIVSERGHQSKKIQPKFKCKGLWTDSVSKNFESVFVKGSYCWF